MMKTWDGERGRRRIAWVGMLVMACLPAAVGASTPAVTCRIELDRAVLPAGREGRAMVKLTLDAIRPVRTAERPPVNLAIVLDRSGSMSGQKLQRAKDAAIEALRRLDARDRFSLVIYDHQVETVVPAQSAANPEAIEPRIREIRAGGNTALFGGVSQGAAEVRKHAGEGFINRIILLSDGLANVGPSSPADLGRLGEALLKEGVSVSTIGVGTDYNEDLMTRLSQTSDGNTYFCEDSRDLARIFGAELGDVLNVMARDIRIEIGCADGVRPLRILGRQGIIRGQTLELNLNQLYGGQEKYVLFEVEVPAGRPGEQREIAMAHVRYRDALSEAEQSVRADVRGRFSEREEEVAGSASPEVGKAVVITVSATAAAAAVEHADQGDTDAAVGLLLENAARYEEAGVRLKDEDLTERAREMRESAADIKAEGGMSRRQRKSIRTEVFMDYNQQKSAY